MVSSSNLKNCTEETHPFHPECFVADLCRSPGIFTPDRCISTECASFKGQAKPFPTKLINLTGQLQQNSPISNCWLALSLSHIGTIPGVALRFFQIKDFLLQPFGFTSVSLLSQSLHIVKKASICVRVYQVHNVFCFSPST